MDSLVCAMSVMTPSEMMSRMKYCEPSVTADAYLAWRETGGQRSNQHLWHVWLSWERDTVSHFFSRYNCFFGKFFPYPNRVSKDRKWCMLYRSWSPICDCNIGLYKKNWLVTALKSYRGNANNLISYRIYWYIIIYWCSVHVLHLFHKKKQYITGHDILVYVFALN